MTQTNVLPSDRVAARELLREFFGKEAKIDDVAKFLARHREDSTRALVEVGEFLAERLAEFENELEDGISFREFCGHVSPALARFKSALASAGGRP